MLRLLPGLELLNASIGTALVSHVRISLTDSDPVVPTSRGRLGRTTSAHRCMGDFKYQSKYIHKRAYEFPSILVCSATLVCSKSRLDTSPEHPECHTCSNQCCGGVKISLKQLVYHSYKYPLLLAPLSG